MDPQKMVPISPEASNLITLVAESPGMSEERVAELLSYLDIDDSQRDLVRDVVEVIREQSLHPEAPRQSVISTIAEDIAQAYMRWAADNAAERNREERRIRGDRKTATIN